MKAVLRFRVCVVVFMLLVLNVFNCLFVQDSRFIAVFIVFYVYCRVL